jgi:hypothetical protein
VVHRARRGGAPVRKLRHGDLLDAHRPAGVRPDPPLELLRRARGDGDDREGSAVGADVAVRLAGVGVESLRVAHHRSPPCCTPRKQSRCTMFVVASFIGIASLSQIISRHLSQISLLLATIKKMKQQDIGARTGVLTFFTGSSVFLFTRDPLSCRNNDCRFSNKHNWSSVKFLD